MYERRSALMLPTLSRTNSREIECIDTRIVGVDTTEHIVHMGEYNDILAVICEVINNDDCERLAGYKCEYLQNCKIFGFEIGINTFKDSLYSQLLTSVFYKRNMPRGEFYPYQLVDKHVKVVVGIDNGPHLLGFRQSGRRSPHRRSLWTATYCCKSWSNSRL